MATFVWKNCKIYWHEFDLSAVHNELSLSSTTEALDDTAFGDATRTRVAGLKDWEVSASGWWEAGSGEPDTELWGDIGTANKVLSLCPTGTDGEICYFSHSVIGAYSPMGQSVGELHRFTFNSYAETDLYRGTIIFPMSTKTSSSSGTGRNVGAVGAAQSVYGVLHCTAASAGDTLDVIVQSDSDNSWLSPTSRITFSQVSGATETAEFKSTAGAIADTWWRVSYTIAGATPSFTFFVAIAIA